MDYHALFHTIHPGFFDKESIRSLPQEDIFEEQLLDLHAFSPADISLSCSPHITFGLYEGNLEPLHAAIREVDAEWPQYFSAGDAIYCAFDGERVVSFCLLDDFGAYQGKRVGGPGCVGTVPAYRKQGIGLKMVQNATELLQKQGYDMSYIHYTAVGHWYARLGYQTIIRWNAMGFVE